ncbi:MAG: homoprotocatechuate degradation operon regulator HpaR [Steroidobacteraceae bacterium]
MTNRDSAFRYRNVPLLLLHLRERHLARFRPLLTRKGLTEQQWRVIRLLVDHGSLEPREIGRLCGFSSPSLTGVLARMDELGLVVRERHARDQRRLHVSLTARARRLAVAMAPEIDAIYERIRADVGEPLYARLCEAIEHVIAQLEAAPHSGRKS